MDSYSKHIIAIGFHLNLLLAYMYSIIRLNDSRFNFISVYMYALLCSTWNIKAVVICYVILLND